MRNLRHGRGLESGRLSARVQSSKGRKGERARPDGKRDWKRFGVSAKTRPHSGNTRRRRAQHIIAYDTSSKYDQRHEAFTPCKKKACRRACRRVRQVMQKAPTHTAQQQPAGSGGGVWLVRARARARADQCCMSARLLGPTYHSGGIPNCNTRGNTQDCSPPSRDPAEQRKGENRGGYCIQPRGLQTGNHCNPRGRSQPAVAPRQPRRAQLF